MGWFGFWIFAVTCVAVDAWLYSRGHDGLFFTHETRADKALRDKLLHGQRLPAAGESGSATGAEHGREN